MFEKIAPEKDVDGLNPITQGKLWVNGDVNLLPATTRAIYEAIIKSHYILDPNLDLDLNEFLTGKHVVIINRSIIIGKPLTALFLLHDCTVTIAHSKTRNLAAITRQADILVSATGNKNFISAEMIKPGVIIIDAGFNKEQGKIYGDVDPKAIATKASCLSPVPDGIGPIGVAMLIDNTVLAAQFQKSKKLLI